MSDSDRLCTRCAREWTTCCQEREIYVTPGDAARIAAFTGRTDFTVFRTVANLAYADHPDDPVWIRCVFRPDGTRRTLAWQPSGDCTFLENSGCALPLDVRPLVCRLYPFDYTAAGLLPAYAGGCPTHLVLPTETLETAVGLSRADATRWHRQLYAELEQETDPDVHRPDLRPAA